jgi:hypothetical protein
MAPPSIQHTQPPGTKSEPRPAFTVVLTFTAVSFLVGQPPAELPRERFPR